MTGNHEMLLLVGAISREKSIDAEHVFQALEESMAFAAKKKLGEDALVRVAIDRKTGETHMERFWRVREDNIIDVAEQEVARVDMEPGQESLTEMVEPLDVSFGRASAQLAKQSIYQKLREIEQKTALENLEEDGEKLLMGSVRGFQKGAAILEIGRLEAHLPKSEQLPRDRFVLGARVMCSIKSVEKIGTRTVTVVTRASTEFMRALLEQEVPEVGDGLVEIVSLARLPGVRTKMVVRLSEEGERRSREEQRDSFSRGSGIDPVRAVIGSRGLHAKAISEELGGEHLDVMLYNENVGEAVIQALAPAQVLKVDIDEDARAIDVALEESSLGLAIGSRGANVRLVGEALGYTLRVHTEEAFNARKEEHTRKLIDRLKVDLEADEDICEILVQNGFQETEEVAYAPIDELLAIEEFDEELVNALRARARDADKQRQTRLTQHELPARETLGQIAGITSEEIEQLLRAEIFGAQDLADEAADEVAERLEWPQKRAVQLVLAARDWAQLHPQPVDA